MDAHVNGAELVEPDLKVSVRQVFGIDSDMEVPAFSQASTPPT